MAKYATRGFGVYVPKLNTEHIDFGCFVEAKLSDLKGLARLVKVSIEMETAALPQTVYDRRNGLQEREGRPILPERLGSLRGESVNSMTADEKLLCV